MREMHFQVRIPIFSNQDMDLSQDTDQTMQIQFLILIIKNVNMQLSQL